MKREKLLSKQRNKSLIFFKSEEGKVDSEIISSETVCRTLLIVYMARNMDEKQPLLKNENQTQIDIDSLGTYNLHQFVEKSCAPSDVISRAPYSESLFSTPRNLLDR